MKDAPETLTSDGAAHSVEQAMPGRDAARAADGDALKQSAILGAAMRVASRYGFKRTSMADIAEEAGMSRPALYQHFRNKKDIARRMIESYFETAEHAVRDALNGDGPIEEILTRAFEAKAGAFMEPLLDSPHGADLLDVKQTQARDIVEAGMARLQAVFADWLARETAAGRIVLHGTPEDEAAVLLRALDGVKQPPYAAFVRHRDRLAQVLGRGLAAPAPRA